MKNSKKIFAVGFATFFVVSLCIAGLVSAQAGPFNNKGEVLGSKNLTVFDLDEKGAPIQGTGRQVIKYAYKSNVRVVDELDEIISRRTKHSKTFSLGNINGREVYKTEIISGAPQYYKDGLGRWWQAEYATSTPEEFAKRNESLGDKIFALLGVEKVWATTSTFYPDEDSGSSSVDADIFTHVSSWSGARDATTGSASNNSNTYGYIYTQNSGGFTNIGRAFTHFDTSFIGTDTIDSATVSIYGEGGYYNSDNDGNDYLNIYLSTTASDDAIVNDDFDECGETAGGSNLDWGSVSSSGYNDIILSSVGKSWINKTGITKLCWREGHDVLDDPIAGSSNNQIQISFADTSGTSQDPKLVIVHSFSGPIISNVQSSNITASSAVVSWNTDVTSDSKVIYGTTTPVENSSSLYTSYNSNLVTSHERSLSLLNNNTTYYYKTVSTKDGVSATSSQYSFTTLQNPVTYAYKPQDQSTTSQSTLFVDDDLSVTLDANSTYIITAAITASSTATQPDIKTSFNTPPGSSMALTFGSFDGSTKVAGSGLFANDSDEVSIDLPSTGVVVIHIDGSVTTGSTAGTVDFEWAQNTSSADEVKLFKGSYLRAEKIE